MENCIHCISCRGMRSTTRIIVHTDNVDMPIPTIAVIIWILRVVVCGCVYLCISTKNEYHFKLFMQISVLHESSWRDTQIRSRNSILKWTKKWRTLSFTQSIYSSIYPCFFSTHTRTHAYSTHTNANLHLGPVEVCLKINENKWDEICLLCTV